MCCVLKTTTINVFISSGTKEEKTLDFFFDGKFFFVKLHFSFYRIFIFIGISFKKKKKTMNQQGFSQQPPYPPPPAGYAPGPPPSKWDENMIFFQNQTKFRINNIR